MDIFTMLGAITQLITAAKTSGHQDPVGLALQVVDVVAPSPPTSADRTTEELEHVARWVRIRALIEAMKK